MYGFYVSIISRKEKYRFYDHYSRSVLNLFERFYTGDLPKGIKSICIEVYPHDEEVRGSEIVMRDKTMLVPIQSNVDKYPDLVEGKAKKEFFLKLFILGVERLQSELAWIVEAFKETYKKVEEADYINEACYLMKISPTRKYSGEVLVEHEVEYSDIYLQVRDRSTNCVVIQKKVKRELPVEQLYYQILGKVKWINKTEVHLYSKYSKRPEQVIVLTDYNLPYL